MTPTAYLDARPTTRPTPTRHRQHGSVLLFGLIAMTILLISAVALVRSFNGTLFNAGNVAFKRDLLNRAERVWPVVLAEVQSGGTLFSEAARNGHVKSKNYYAMNLPDLKGRGMPEALYDPAAFATVGDPDRDIDAGDGVTVRYMIDRLCSAVGPTSADKCTLADGGRGNAVGAKNMIRAEDDSAAGAGALVKQVVYRISIRVTGPRNTQAFYQTTFIL